MQGLLFNQMRSKAKVLQKKIAVGGEFPDWSYDGSRCAAGQKKKPQLAENHPINILPETDEQNQKTK